MPTNPSLSRSHATPRNLGLDIVRSIAILLVLIDHIVLSNFGKARPSVYFAEGLTGYLGVDLFFVLSGSLIAGSVFRRIQRGEPFGWQSLLPFWKRRWYRTLPNYALALACYVGLEIGAGKGLPANVWRYPGFLQSFAPPWHCEFYNVSWSLCAEEWFYLSLPVLVAAGLALAHGERRGMVGAIVAPFALPLVARLVLASGWGWDIYVSKASLFRLDSIAAGVAVAYASVFRPDLYKRIARPGVAVVGAVVAVLSAGMIWRHLEYSPYTAFATLSRFGLYANVLSFPVSACALAPVIAWAAAAAPAKPTKPWSIGRAVEWFAILSYATYLFHDIALNAVHTYLWRFLPHGHAGLVAGMLLQFAAALALASAVYFGWERWTTNLRERT